MGVTCPCEDARDAPTRGHEGTHAFRWPAKFRRAAAATRLRARSSYNRNGKNICPSFWAKPTSTPEKVGSIASWTFVPNSKPEFSTHEDENLADKNPEIVKRLRRTSPGRPRGVNRPGHQRKAGWVENPAPRLLEKYQIFPFGRSPPGLFIRQANQRSWRTRHFGCYGGSWTSTNWRKRIRPMPIRSPTPTRCRS